MATKSKGLYKKRETNPDGQPTQKGYHLKIDSDLVEWYESQPNRTRYINNLVRKDKQRHQRKGGRQPPEASERV